MATQNTNRPLSVRGFITTGVVVSDRAKRTVIVQRDMVTYISKYKRYARKISKIAAHNPDEINARTGDVVQIAECRRMSKTKAWVVIKVLTKGRGMLMPGQVKAHDEAQRKKEKEEKEAASAKTAQSAHAQQ